MQAKVMKMMPIIFTFFFLWFPAGLVLYWIVNNCLSILQQWYITRRSRRPARRPDPAHPVHTTPLIGASCFLEDRHVPAFRQHRRHRHRHRARRRRHRPRFRSPGRPAGAGDLRRELPPRHAHYGNFLAADGSVLDAGIALFFPGPNSFTGEDVLELQGHGGPVILDLLLRRTLEEGARLARRVNSANAPFSTTSSTWPRPKPSPTSSRPAPNRRRAMPCVRCRANSRAGWRAWSNS